MDQVEIDKICRLCCEKKGRLRSLYEQRADHQLSLQQIIFELSRLEVAPEDGMPQKICKWCINTLLKMYETIESYRSNDLKLRAQLRPLALVEIKQEEEEIDLDLLENALMQDLKVEEIPLKQESELHQESADSDKLNEHAGTTKDPSDDDIEDEEAVIDKEDGEWKPTEGDTKDEKLPVKKLKRKTKQENDTDSQPKRGRRSKKDPNRPRLHDHKCYICKSESQGSAEALIAHLTSNHLDLMPYTCPDCVMETIVIKTVQKLNAHKRQHLNPEKCPHCDRRYTDKKNLAFHVETYHDDPCPSICEHCGKEFPTKTSMMYHMKVHTSAASCEFCGKVFKERQKLRRHIQSRHEKLKKHECNICKKKLGSLDSVKTHMQTFHLNQEFKCSYCPKTFAAEGTHRAHEKKHIENPDYVSTKEWSKYYTNAEGEDGKPDLKNKKCKLCGQVCVAIWEHLGKVHFPTEYRCHICDATFNRKQSHTVHMARHEGKEWECPICNRKVTEKKNLIAHLRTKQHRDHPLAQSLDWLGLTAKKAGKPKKAANDDDTQQQEYDDIEVGIDDSL